MTKPKLADLSRQAYSLEDVMQIMQELSSKDDREAAIVGAAIIEAELEKLLRSHMVGLDENAGNELFSRSAPLATAWAKAKVAMALGFISKELQADITQLGKIRNAFAHSARSLTFSHSLVSEECAKLTMTNEAALRRQIDNLPHDAEEPDALVITDELGFVGFKTILSDSKTSRSRYLNCVICIWFVLIANSTNPTNDTV